MSNPLFGLLVASDPQLARLGQLAERYLLDDPNTALLKLRQFAELLAQSVSARAGIPAVQGASQYDLLRNLSREGVLPQQVFTVFDTVRREGNAANHALQGDEARALDVLKFCWILGVWYLQTFVDAGYQCDEFVTPTPTATLSRLELEQLRQEVEAAKDEAQRHLDALEAQAPLLERAKLLRASEQAAKALPLNENEVRKLIDLQLEALGWEVDSQQVRHAKGTRPEKGKNKAIAEWPTQSGPADYVFFVGLLPVGVVEAKKHTADVATALEQAKRYSRDFQPSSASEVSLQLPLLGGPWGEYQIPFVFASNGRPYLKQQHTQSGVWFRDVRRSQNPAKPLGGWYSPEGLSNLLKMDLNAAESKLEQQPFDYDFQLRPFQIAAIRAVEQGISSGRREMLLAMATGTGKTKTCIALVYRLLKAQRFARILFLVDRSALGEQAENAFKDTRMENLQTFADIFGLQTSGSVALEAGNSVQITTVQGMVRRLMYPSEGSPPLAVDAYDCIVIDECHRGYTLDRELSEVEQTFRDEADYVSKYRRVLEYFDALKVGLTATPALHTVQIFGEPIYSYSYREAVLDGYLIDHGPPLQIVTELSQEGINWAAGEEVKMVDTSSGELLLYQTPDDIGLEISSFNRKVITEGFNRAVCLELARHIDPASLEKTLVFCANDDHASLVVTLLKEAFTAQYGEVDDDAVVKITGKADDPLGLIKRYKNERLPTVAVTVDLLTTGIDVAQICNLVFLRRVGSRILFEQMLGRATRRCDKIGKEIFRIYDAVRAYEALEEFTSMKPVVTNPKISFAQLEGELLSAPDHATLEVVREQLTAKLQAKRGHLSESARQDFVAVSGMTPEVFVETLRSQPLEGLAAWYGAFAGLGEFLDRKNLSNARTLLISEHPDQVIHSEYGYGKAQRPQDYLESFADYLRQNQDRLPALLALLTRPSDLKRSELRSLVLELDRANFTEAMLESAWRETQGVDIAARVVGFIRGVALQEPLLSFEARVDAALRRILSSQNWSQPQRTWLSRIAAQTKANLVVDREALEDKAGVFQREGGSYDRLNRLFEGHLLEVLQKFNAEVWAA
jgi:type I restriction enzyme, R subunit